MRGNVVGTGGAGFVGSNLAANLARDGWQVTVYDALLRVGSEHNLAWLREVCPGQCLRFVHGDVRDAAHLQAVTEKADVIYHLAAQVAVTSSLTDPSTDFAINALGTLNALEAARRSTRRPIVVFTSTNKVYGAMEAVPTVESADRYAYRDFPNGIAETQSLDFHSPYGCSKGAADQYVRDYSRIYGLPTVVFRMSCIYGPRQFGNEDQGWVAHFLISALTGRPITIYGDGKQVRDILYVSDLVRAFRLAVERIDTVAGEVFNIGGGPPNTLSVWGEFGELLRGLTNRAIPVEFEEWRPGDQPCYVSNIEKARSLLGWSPLVDIETGVRRLADWIRANPDLFHPGAAPRLPARADRPGAYVWSTN